MPSVARKRLLVKPTLPIGVAPQACGPQGRLGNYANNSSPPALIPRFRKKKSGDSVERQVRRRAKRRQRYQLRHGLRKFTTLKRVKACGHTPIGNPRAGPSLKVADLNGQRIAGLGGIAHCGSVWACPACSAKIATRRSEELADVQRFALEHGCSASLVTLTMRHHAGHQLRDVWDALSYAWSRVTSGKQWETDQAAAGLHGWIKAVEVTHGKNGWHVHVHALLIWRDDISEEAAKRVAQRMWRRWDRALSRKGFDSLRDSGGLDVRKALLEPKAAGGLHEYFVKLAYEIAGGQAKLAKGGGRTPFQILSEAVDGVVDDLELWEQWERGSLGRRQIAWSKGLREWAKLAPEQTDEEIAQEELDGEDLLLLAYESWQILRLRWDWVCDLLDAAERGGLAAAGAFLDGMGLKWLYGKGAPQRPPPKPHAPRIDDHALAAASGKLDNRRQLLAEYRRWYSGFAPDPAHPERRLPAQLLPRVAQSDPDRDAFIRELQRFNRSVPRLDV